MDFPSVELIGCRYDEATDDMPGHHAVRCVRQHLALRQ